MRSIIIQPAFYPIKQPYEECVKELPPPSDILAANLFIGSISPQQHIVLADERSSSNVFTDGGFITLVEKAGSGNTYAGTTALAAHCDRREMFGIKPCFLPDYDLKKYIFYLDHLVWPATTCFTNFGGETQLTKFLMSKGILSRHQYDVSDQIYVGNKFFKLFLAAFQQYEHLEEGSACIAQHTGKLWFPSSLCPEGMDNRTAEIRLYNALPVPSDDVSMQDVLEFKVKNHKLLNRLRNHIDGIYLKLIEAGPDVLRRNNMLVSEFEEDVRETMAEMRKSGIRRALSSIAVQFKLPMTITGLGIGEMVAEVPLELGAVMGALAGYVASDLSIKVVRGAGFLGKEGRLEPLAYLSLGAKSLHLDLPRPIQ